MVAEDLALYQLARDDVRYHHDPVALSLSRDALPQVGQAFNPHGQLLQVPSNPCHKGNREHHVAVGGGYSTSIIPSYHIHTHWYANGCRCVLDPVHMLFRV